MNPYPIRNQPGSGQPSGLLSRLFPLILATAALFDAIVAVTLLFSPSMAWLALGQAPAPLILLRWSGGVVLALALGNYLALRKPRGQARWLFLSGLAHLFSGLALMYSLSAGETVGPAPWGMTLAWSALAVAAGLFVAIPAIARRA